MLRPCIIDLDLNGLIAVAFVLAAGRIGSDGRCGGCRFGVRVVNVIVCHQKIPPKGGKGERGLRFEISAFGYMVKIPRARQRVGGCGDKKTCFFQSKFGKDGAAS